VKSKYFQDESRALMWLVIERAKGRAAYMVRYRAGSIEVRSW
jgi:hypothetical protein